ncbi:hypothetical protein [Mesorhizobium sp. CA5]|uniref:hypothetical protein n=1 Tax=Mesorhizobium sp. CA5 TaxID=2876638 RepID=UPI00296206CA|nr:hypothetical protein [Mesorhizobium sp. CA5]
MSIRSCNQPHSVVERAKVKHGQPIELIGDVARVDEGKVTVNLGVPVTVDINTVTLVTAYVPPKRKTPLVDKAT